jgi:hypothetical protein
MRLALHDDVGGEPSGLHVPVHEIKGRHFELQRGTDRVGPRSGVAQAKCTSPLLDRYQRGCRIAPDPQYGDTTSARLRNPPNSTRSSPSVHGRIPCPKPALVAVLVEVGDPASRLENGSAPWHRRATCCSPAGRRSASRRESQRPLRVQRGVPGREARRLRS